MPNARNLNHVLGAVGYELKALSQKWKENVPPIECLVINKANKTPGRGIGFHMPVDEFQRLTALGKRQVLRDLNRDIFGYPKWDDVLQHFKLSPIIPAIGLEAIATKARYGEGGGETDDHRLLKFYIAENPRVMGLPEKPIGKVEFVFPSADEIDVLFKYPSKWVGVEVKGINSDDSDMMRGIFQCVKYQGLMEAVQRYEQLTLGLYRE